MYGLVFKKYIQTERVILIVAYFFSALFALELLLAPSIGSYEKSLIFFMTNIVFLNSIHIGFSFYIFFSSQTLRTWRSAYNKNSSLTIEKKLILVWAIAFASQIFIAATLEAIHFWVKALISFYSFYHVGKQFLGLLLKENHTNLKLCKNKTLNKINLFDHRITNILLGITLIQTVDFFVFKNNLNTIYISSIVGLTSILVWHIYSILILSDQNIRYRYLFLFRYALFPLSPLSFSAAAGMSSIHGIEYYCVTHNIVHNEKKSKGFSSGMIAFIFIVFLCLMSGRSGIPALISFDLGTIGTFFWTTLGAFQVTHYWFDGQLFKMKNSASRNIIAPKV